MSKYNNLPRHSIITGPSALVLQDIISFSPEKVYLEMTTGTNTSNETYENFKISIQKKDTFNLGKIELNNLTMYSLERLFIEFDKFDLENTIKAEGLKKLENRVNVFQVRKLYEKLKNNRRGLDNNRIELFLKRNLLNVYEDIKNLQSDEIKDYLRKYIIALASRFNTPFLLKGGSAVELFIDAKRSTFDIDAHTGFGNNQDILNYLADKKNDVFFFLKETDEDIINNESKKIKKVSLIPDSKSIKIKDKIKNITIPISFNNWYTEEDIKSIINSYELTKQQLKDMNHISSYVFSKEMLLAEKFQGIISKPETSSRSKDLLDIYTLFNSKIKEEKFKKWLFKKWKNQRKSLNKQEAIDIIQKNKDLKLLKIKENFDSSSQMYNIDIDFENALSKYKDLIKIALS